MNIGYVKDFMIDHFPNSKVLKRIAVKQKIKLLEKRLLPSHIIQECENDMRIKEKVVEEYSRKWSKLRIFVDKRIEQTIKSSPRYQNRDDLEYVLTDMRFCYFAYGFLPDEYTYFLLEGKGMEERFTYISAVQRSICVFRMNDFVDMQMLISKERTYRYFKPYFKRDAITISRQSDYEVFSAFVDKHPCFVKKPINLEMGKGIELCCIDEFGKAKEQVFLELIKNGKHILEEPIEQSEITAEFNSSSVNTVRCVSFLTKEGVKCPFGFLRTGRKGAFVDNAGASGIFAAIEMNTGIICTDGMDENGVEYEKHPDSGLRYKGFQLPAWEELISLSMQLAEMLPSVKCIAWDFAYTDNGWVVVEANRGGQPVMQGPLHYGVRKIYEDMMARMDLIC